MVDSRHSMTKVSGITNNRTYRSNDGSRVSQTGVNGRLWRCYENSRQVGVTRDILTVGLFIRGFNPVLQAAKKTWSDDD